MEQFLSVFVSLFQTPFDVTFSCSCHLCLNACNRSLFARGLSIDFPAYVISHHVRWPIRAPLLITPKRPKANSNHTTAWHA